MMYHPILTGDISVHTFSLYHILKYEDYRRMFDRMKEADRNDLWPDMCPGYFYHLPTLQLEKGLRVQLHNQTVCSIQTIVSPLLLVRKQEEDYKSIAPADPAFWNAVYAALSDAFLQWEFPFEPCDCTLSRADPCMNLEMGPEFDIPYFLHCLKHTPCAEGYTLHSFGNPQSDMLSYKIANTMQALAVYAKTAHQAMLFDALPNGSNRLRIEVQMKNKKIGKVYAAPPAWDTLLNLVAHAPQLILDGIRLILPTGDYRTSGDAYQVIYNSDRRGKVKDELWELMQKYSATQSQEEQFAISKAYMDAASPKKFGKRMYCFNELNIAPVCLPDGANVSSLPSLYHLAQEGVRQFEEKKLIYR